MWDYPARLLDNMGAQVYGAARRSAVRARTEEMGIKPLDFKQLQDYIGQMDFIFNSVPALVLDRRLLEKVQTEAIILDLASAPGGIDFKAAEELSLCAELAGSLPGEVAPKTAGKVICRAILEVLEEE